MRSAYRKMRNVQRVMVLTLLHLYFQGKDDFYLKGGYPTKISAAETIQVLRADQAALSMWGDSSRTPAGEINSMPDGCSNSTARKFV